MPAPRTPQNRGPQKPTFSLWWMWLALFALIIGGVVAGGNQGGRGAEAIPYSEFQTLLDQGKVKQVVVSGDQITGTLKQARPNGSTGFVTQRVAPALASELQKHDVDLYRCRVELRGRPAALLDHPAAAVRRPLVRRLALHGRRRGRRRRAGRADECRPQPRQAGP